MVLDQSLRSVTLMNRKLRSDSSRLPYSDRTSFRGVAVLAPRVEAVPGLYRKGKARLLALMVLIRWRRCNRFPPTVRFTDISFVRSWFAPMRKSTFVSL